MTHRQLLPTFLILLAFSACNRQPETTRQSLNGTWRLTGTGTGTVPGTGTGTETGTGTGTETGTVPGALHLDLADDSALFVAGGETEWAWIDSLAPTYSRTFEAKMAGTQDLVFEGIDTYATIFLNGILLGQTHNAHRPWRFPVGDVLRHDSANELIVQFASTVRVGREKLVAHPHPIPASNEPMPVGERTSVFARKPAYAFGWDWGPRFVGCGITGDVYLEARGERGISDARLDVLELREGAARVRMTIHGHGFSAGVGATVETPDSTFQMSLEAGRDGEWWAEWIWPEPPLWWPHTHGNPHLTPVHLTIDEAIEHNFQAGLRQIEWVQAPDSLGRSFALHVNGISLGSNGFLALHDRGYGFKGNSKVNVHAVGNSTLNPSRSVGFCTTVCIEQIVMRTPFHSSSFKTTTVFKSLNRIDGEHSLSELCMKFIKNRLTKSDRYIFDYTSYDTSNGIAFFAYLFDVSFHFSRFSLIGATYGIAFNLGQVNSRGILIK